MGIGEDFVRRISAGEVIVLDGAATTELQRRGVPMDETAWGGASNLQNIDAVRALHEDYIFAGADVIITNTHCTNRAGLEPAGLGERVKDANVQAVKAALQARDAAADRPVAVAGSISSFCPYAMDETGSETGADLRNSSNFREQAEILAEAGVDLLALEMMDSESYGVAAIEAALSTGLPVWLGMSPIRVPSGHLGTYGLTPCVMPEDDPDHPDAFMELAEAQVRPGLAAVTLMHVKTDVIPDALKTVRRYFPDVPVGVYAESGDWTPPDWVFSGLSPEDYLKEAQGWVQAGVQIVGGCCGTGPHHVRALAQGLPKRLGA
ncbi:MAG: hypothetical protein GEV10_25445 [Streptosporangiales bacterium]|nr:hypothetical protein [Streptosporangiales bacterium]